MLSEGFPPVNLPARGKNIRPGKSGKGTAASAVEWENRSEGIPPEPAALLQSVAVT
jgi:hypothetical protein